jgi:folate-binding protein YgfZ
MQNSGKNIMQISSPQNETAVASTESLDAILHGVGVYALQQTTWLRATGEDRMRWMNGMVTNSIQSMAPGQGSYSYVLSAQGRIEGDANVFNTGDALLVETSVAQREHLLQWLDHYIIMDDVLLEPEDAFAGICIAGPDAAKALAALLPGVALPSAMGLMIAEWQGHALRIVAAYSPLVPKYELWIAPENLAALQDAMKTAYPNAVACSNEAVEWLRLLEGTPRYGTDVRNTNDKHELPQETALQGEPMRALHFAKGCYLGQEIVERIRSRGNVHRTFNGFLIDGDAPATGAIILAEDKDAGEITSSARISLKSGEITLALGYIRREALDRKLPLTCDGATVHPITLPYAAV